MSDDIPMGPPQRGDLTQGPLFKTLALFSLPVLLGNVLQSLNGSVNTVWIGRLLGEDALAATSNSNIVMFLVFAAIFGISMATTVHCGQSRSCSSRCIWSGWGSTRCFTRGSGQTPCGIR